VRTIRAIYPSCPIILLASIGDHQIGRAHV
jgi:hypothetical protein